jgi:hypothetical protein
MAVNLVQYRLVTVSIFRGPAAVVVVEDLVEGVDLTPAVAVAVLMYLLPSMQVVLTAPYKYKPYHPIPLNLTAAYL